MSAAELTVAWCGSSVRDVDQVRRQLINLGPQASRFGLRRHRQHFFDLLESTGLEPMLAEDRADRPSDLEDLP